MANPKHLELARQGRNVWNQWRKENPDEPADFSGVDFTTPENHDICFAEFDFGDNANFSQVKFGNLAKELQYKSAAEILDVLEQDSVPGVGAIFIGATFGEHAKFTGATFGSWTLFIGASFGGLAKFDYTTFGQSTSFSNATFGSSARFDYAKFAAGAHFFGTTFEGSGWFAGATFGCSANFSGAAFGEWTNFDITTFDDGITFDGATFGDSTRFNGATFGKQASFKGATFGNQIDFFGVTFRGDAYFDALSDEKLKQHLEKWAWKHVVDESKQKRLEMQWQEAERNPSGFEDISFYNSRFHGCVYFVNRNFDGEADFAFARFQQPPDFRGTKGHDNLNWSSVRFSFHGTVFNIPTPGWTIDERIGANIRRLRKIATNIFALDAERNLLILQRMAERGVLWKTDWYRPWRPLIPTVLMSSYRLLSNCGRSMLLPLLWMFASNAGVFSLYKSQIVPDPQPEVVTDALWTFTLANAVPFGGAPQQSLQQAIKVLFGDGTIPPWVQMVSIFQGIVSALLIFLLLLSMRNYFRFK